LEDNHNLNPLSDLDLFVLHTVFLPRINHLLKEFTESWNNHPMRNERNWSPKKMWLNGIINPLHSSEIAIRDALEVDPAEYGIDHDGPLPIDLLADETAEVVVPETVSILTGDELQQFVEEVDPLGECDDYGVGKYILAHQILQTLHFELS